MSSRFRGSLNGAGATWKCETCGCNLNSLSQLRQHKLTHQRSFKCTKCPMTFNTTSDLISHVEAKHSNPSNSNYQRPNPIAKKKSANQKYSNKMKLGSRKVSTVLSIDDLLKFRCSYCGMAFLYYGGLDGHMRMHTGEKPFRCPDLDCPFRASQKGGIISHVNRVHREKKPIKCTQCSASFLANRYLSGHIELHRAYSVVRSSGQSEVNSIAGPDASTETGPSFAVATVEPPTTVTKTESCDTGTPPAPLSGRTRQLESETAYANTGPLSAVQEVDIKTSSVKPTRAVNNASDTMSQIHVGGEDSPTESEIEPITAVSIRVNTGPGIWKVIYAATAAGEGTERTTFRFPPSSEISFEVAKLETKHTTVKMSCSICEKVCSGDEELKAHELTHTGAPVDSDRSN